MPVITADFGWCGWGKSAGFPPAYRLGLFTIGFTCLGLNEIRNQDIEEERLAGERRLHETLTRIRLAASQERR